MKRKQTHVRSKSSVTTSALIGAALVASLGAAAAGFASLDTQPYFKVANTSNPTSQPSTSQPVGNTTSTPPTLPVVITSSTPFSYADLLASGLFNPQTSTSTPRTIENIKSLKAGHLVHLKLPYAENLAYLSNKDGVMYMLGKGDKILISKWLTYATPTPKKLIENSGEWDMLRKFYVTHKQGIKSIDFIPGNQIFLHPYKKTPIDTKTSNLYFYYGADKKMYGLPVVVDKSGRDVVDPLVLQTLATNTSKMSVTVDFGYKKGNDYYGKPLTDSYTGQPCPCFKGPNSYDHLQKIEVLPSTDTKEIQTFFADKNKAAAATKYPTLQTLLDSYYSTIIYKW